MALTDGDVVVRDPVEIAFTVEAVMWTPPFPRWASSRSGDRLRATVADHLGAVADALAIRAMYTTIPLADAGIEPYDPPAALLDAGYVVPGVLTIGDGVDGTGDGLLEGLVVDAMENVALQLARVELLTDIRASANDDGLATTRVFPPGARGDGWDMENRRFMFEVLPTDRIDVHLEDGRVTTPRKTFSFAMGVGDDVEQAELLLACSDCEFADDCPYVGSVVA